MNDIICPNCNESFTDAMKAERHYFYEHCAPAKLERILMTLEDLIAIVE